MVVIVGKVGEGGLINVKDPRRNLAVASEIELCGVFDGLLDHRFAVPAVELAEHVVADVPLALQRHRFPVTDVVGLHSEPPTIA